MTIHYSGLSDDDWLAQLVPDNDDVPACDACAADSTLTQVAPGVLQLSVFHDAECPVLARYEDLGRARGGDT